MPAGSVKKTKASHRLPAGFSAFSLCFLIASLIWLINELDKEHRYTMEAELAYRNNQASSLPFKLRLEIKGSGFDLFSTWSALHRIWEIDESMFNSGQPISAIHVARQYLASQNNRLDILSTHPAFLPPPNSHFPYQKRLKVIASYRITPQSGFMQDGPAVVYPDSVTLYSNSPLPDSVKSIRTRPLVRNKVNQPAFGSVSLEAWSDMDYRTSRSLFWVYVPVGAGTSYRIRLNLQRGEGLPVNSILLPSSVEVNALVPVRSLNRVQPSSFEARADLLHPEQKKALVNLVRVPPRSQILQVRPTSVDYYFNR